MMSLRGANRHYLWIVCIALLLAASILQAQSVTAKNVVAPTEAASEPVTLPEYDVVSIKPNKGDSQNMSWSWGHGSLSGTNVTLHMMVVNAWSLKEAQLTGLPKWADSAHFDVQAKVTDPDEKLLAALTPEQFDLMEQPILTDRFRLKYHFEKKVLPVYDLVLAKSGPKMKETTPAETASTTGVNGVHTGGFLIQNNLHGSTLKATGVSLSSFADTLSGQVNRIVVDKTGLTGKYNYKMDWTPDDAGSAAADASPAPDIFTALQEQLGLKLEPAKAEEQVFVVDHVEMPSEN